MRPMPRDMNLPLLAPIADTAPCGVDLRLWTGGDADYFQLKDLRAVARAIERRADADDEAQSPLGEWQRIRALATTLLESRTKDMEIAVWLTEALVRLDGFTGLAAGFGLISGLVDRYWDQLFPLPDEEGTALRLAPLAGLNGVGAEGTLIQPIRKVPLSPADGNGAPVAFWHYELAQRAIRVPDARQRPSRTPPPDLDELARRMAATPPEHKAALVADIRACRTAFATLEGQLARLCGPEAPPSSTIAHILEEVEDAVRFLTGHRDQPQPAPAAGPADDVNAPASARAVPAQAMANGDILPPVTAIVSREDAFRLLEEIARYFRRTEPHSPLSYTIEDLVRRGRMPLPELLAELLQDQTARHTLLTAAGIRPPQP